MIAIFIDISHTGSSWYGFLELIPSRPSLANLDVEIIESTDNEFSAPMRSDDDTGDEIDADHRIVSRHVFLHDKEDGKDNDDSERTPETERLSSDNLPAPIAEEVTAVKATPTWSKPAVKSDTDDVVLRHHWPLASSGMS